MKTKEPDYRTEKEMWMLWNMLEYDNDIKTAYQLLKQREINDECFDKINKL